MGWQAVILAGGLGTRLWPITRDIPKPMVEIAGKPYLEYQLKYLKYQGCSKVLLLIGYLGEQLIDYFHNGDNIGMEVVYSRETEPMGTAGALRLAADHIDNAFLLLYGDSFLPIKYDLVLSRLHEIPSATGVVVVYDNKCEDTSVVNNVSINNDNWVVGYNKMGGNLYSHVDAGVLAFRKNVISYIPSGKVSLEQEIFPRLIHDKTLMSWTTFQRFYDIGTPERLATIEQLFKSTKL